MKEFNRMLSDKYKQMIIKALVEEPLFKHRLKKDIQDGVVFPAIREDRIVFYYYDRALFNYEREGKKWVFTTNDKFGFVPKKYNSKAISETDIKKMEIGSFLDSYELIKERAKVYTHLEAIGKHAICKAGNFVKAQKDDFVVLDTEVAFDNSDENVIELYETITDEIESKTKNSKESKVKTQDKIDLLLYRKSTKELLFVEAKDYSNPEITGEIPVIKQVYRYNKQIKERDKEVLSVYRKYVEDVNSIFKTKIPLPEKVHPYCGLIIYGFDKDQRTNRLKEIINNIRDKSKNQIKVYKIGDARNIKIETLYKKCYSK